MANCGHNQRHPCGLVVVPADDMRGLVLGDEAENPKTEIGQSAQNNSLFHPGPEVQTEIPHFRYFRYSSYFFTVLEKSSVTAVQPVEGRQGRSCVLGSTHRSHRGTEESGSSGQPSGAGDLVRRHEPCVPEGPECHSAVWPDHQVGDAAIVERQAEPAFWRELQRPGRRRNMLKQGALSPKRAGVRATLTAPNPR